MRSAWWRIEKVTRKLIPLRTSLIRVCVSKCDSCWLHCVQCLTMLFGAVWPCLFSSVILYYTCTCTVASQLKMSFDPECVMRSVLHSTVGTIVWVFTDQRISVVISAPVPAEANIVGDGLTLSLPALHSQLCLQSPALFSELSHT